MNKRKGKGQLPKEKRLVDYKDLERNVLNEIAKEFSAKKKKGDK